ncbi:unnamed protein product [Kluyveromyces dobzhanskii CBS 2104]|uniref:WGS project CCBQ000000000 data, contig 00008 n=1 Tax=Kluyveromyces dobzhanskii CBS 2104 TaxID=1427455 RepID=A0A0A8L9X5_9SACH|nr:unnamed protein product [Kluyveromyces dobzhanskii CBS 2104]
MLKEYNHVGPSLAVKFYKQWCLCSQGPYVEVFDYSKGSSVNRCQIFHRNKVHGIRVDEESNKILFYGGKSVSIVKLNDIFSNSDVLSEEKVVPQWIMSGEFSHTKNRIFLLTSYNRVMIVDPLNLSITRTETLEGECSILYSGSIKVLPNQVLICAGTIMNGIIVWDLNTKKKVYTLHGHEGAIFCVVASKSGKLLASCSDDRSIKIWDLESGNLLSTAWGHTARIWNLQFYNEDKQLISVSEDCTCRVWNYKNAELTMKDIFEVSLTKNVWSVDVEEAGLVAVTGGNDGRLKLIELESRSRHYENMEFSLQTISEVCEGFQYEKGETVKGFHWFDFGLVLITSHGNILQYLKFTKDWNTLDSDDRYASFSITQGNGNTVFFINNKCLLRSYAFDKSGSVLQRLEFELEDISKTVNCLAAFNNGFFYLIIESPNHKDPLVTLKFEENSCTLTEKYILKKPQNMISSCAEVFDNHLLIGARFSLGYVFDLSSVTKSCIVIKTQATDVITSVDYVETSKDGDVLFSMTNRDGTFFFFTIDFDRSDYRIIHTNRISKGFLEGSFYDSDEDFLVYGFKSNLFHIYNESQQCEIFSEPYGGAHRQWKLFGSYGKDMVLCFVMNSGLKVVNIQKSEYPRVLKEGTHGREIRDTSFQKCPNSIDEKKLFITGSEDTTVKLSTVDSNSGVFRNFWTLKAHVSGLQRCKFINDTFFVTCGAREELFLWELSNEFSNPYVNLKQKLTPSMDNPDLRIMDFDVLFLMGDTWNFIMATVYSDSSVKLWSYSYKDNKFSLVIDGKYETCCIWNVALVPLDNCLKLLIAPTDGHFIVWDITDLIPYQVRRGQLFEAGFENGTKQLPGWSNKFQVHAAGVKSFAVSTDIASNSFKVYSGGDDNAISITNFSSNSAEIMEVELLSSDLFAASSTVTSVNLIDSNTKLLTTSADQIIRIWDITHNKLNVLESKYTTIADTGCSDIIPLEDGKGYLILVGGQGLSYWQS